MTPLASRLARLIAQAGPISLPDFFSACLLDPEHGYYTTREPFGAGGDFTTAPEISQMFGELVAVWLVSAWDAAGQPAGATVAELGPGRGTLMSDIIRTMHSLSSELPRILRFAMIEASPRLAGIQKRTLAGAPALPDWHAGIETLPPGPVFVVGNEIFDALPLRQFVRAADGWRERMVGRTAEGALAFVPGPLPVPASALPAFLADASAGTVFEAAPAREALMEVVARRIAADGGAALFFDYGHVEPSAGDTLQSVRLHRHVDVLDFPGEADLTSHVDFDALATVARGCGLGAYLATQRGFLVEMGIRERAASLSAGKDEATRHKIAGEAERLIGHAAMGTLFKVLAAAPPGLAVPGFSIAD